MNGFDNDYNKLDFLAKKTKHKPKLTMLKSLSLPSTSLDSKGIGSNLKDCFYMGLC